MPRLDKRDPIYYRNEMNKLLDKAKENDVEYYYLEGGYVSFHSPITSETVSCRLPSIGTIILNESFKI